MLELLSAEPYSLQVKNSRFLAELFPVATQDAAREILMAQKNRWPDIRHVVHAMVIGPQANILGCSDDGEPSGTAGRPALEVLKGSGITNVLLTIARWFGGTKLGTGGLVHAYGDAAKGVIAQAQTREIIAMAVIDVVVPFAVVGAVQRACTQAGLAIDAQEYTADGVRINGAIAAEAAEALRQRLTDITRGKALFAADEEQQQ